MKTAQRIRSIVAQAGSAALIVGWLIGCSPADESASPETAISTIPLVPTHSPAPVTPSATETPTPAPSATPIIEIDDTLPAVTFRIPLTVRHVTSTGAELYFELSAPASGALIYWPEGQPDNRMVLPFDDPAATTQRVQVTGLTPGMRYQALVGLSTDGRRFESPGYQGAAWGIASFQAWGERQPLRIGVIGDAGLGDPITVQLAAEMATYDLDFVIHTGDVVYNVFEDATPYEAFARKFYQPFAPLLHRMPVYTVVGNHDVEWATYLNNAPFYYHAFPPFADQTIESSARDGLNQWYAFAYGKIQFVMLDTQAFYGEKGRAEQLEWLAGRLNDTRFAYTIPSFHMPPYTSGLHERDGLPVRSDWQPLFEAAQVPLVLSGHDHNYERLEVNGLTYLVSGGGSATLYRKEHNLAESRFFARQSHFTLLEIYPDRIEITAIAAGGEILEKHTIPLTPQ